MAYLFQDPLLSITRKLIRIFYRMCFVFAALTLLVGLGGLTFGINTGQYAHNPPPADNSVVFLFIILAPLLMLYGWFFRILWQIVDTVAVGSPFVSANADRLTRMGWLAVALKLLMLLALVQVRFFGVHFKHVASFFDGPGLLFILVLFVLARVFRQGALMRDDLEGTV